MTALVAVENTLFSFDKLFSYEIPDDMSVSAGMRVVVPFGKGSRKRVGLVFGTAENPEENMAIKPVAAVIDEKPVISEELLHICKYLRDNTFCTYYDAFRAVLPPGLSYSIKCRCSLEENYGGELTADESKLIAELKSADKSTFDALIAGNKKLVESLTERGALHKEEQPKRKVGNDNVTMYRLAEAFPEEKLTPKQRAVVDYVAENESVSGHDICYNLAVTPAVIKRLLEKKILERYESVIFRSEITKASENPDDILLSPKQQQIHDGILDLMNSPKPECALLRGVTGSGKTSIFIKLINRALKQGKSAIMLVPEISLTPQMVGKFQRLFGSEVAIMHSSLSMGERADEYRRIKEGKAHIVIGTRSAVFAPVENLGIIVIDEEGESSYKSESTPRYHARDVAKQRSFFNNSLLLLASATPSLESYYFAKQGRYHLFEIEERYNNAVLPEVQIVNMVKEREQGNMSNFSSLLVDELEYNLAKGEQSILLLNRRGYRTGVRCACCGKPMECPNCSVPLTYHKVNNSLICHCCGYMRRADNICPFCGSKIFSMKGEGTQLVEDEIAQRFPSARILRMDADTTSGKAAYERNFKAFAEGDYDIMVGTQMIAKGLNFPNVTLVGVLKTDNSLYAADFRAYERTFSLITQVVGRSGRGDKRGRALIQTFSPDHYVINLAARQNYPAFYDEEIKLREAMFYPPYCDIVVIGFSSVSNDHCRNAARKFGDMIFEETNAYNGKVPVRILGPAPNTIGKVNGKFRYSLLIKCYNSKPLREAVENALKRANADFDFKDVSVFADINGNLN